MGLYTDHIIIVHYDYGQNGRILVEKPRDFDALISGLRRDWLITDHPNMSMPKPHQPKQSETAKNMLFPMKYMNYPPVIQHGLLENGPLLDDCPIETSIHREFYIAMFDYQRVS